MSPVNDKLPINGILLVNKPQGLSSNAVLQKVKHLYHAKKAGHTGSLDPLATGMLPVCFGEATKLSQYLLDADKVYIATGMLGIKTDTADALGTVIAKADEFSVSEVQLFNVLQQFTGDIQQVPSMFSALKHQGTPLYKFARAGKTIERKARSITIEALELLSFNGVEFVIKVSCSKGTYIRNLVEDIGEELGVYAHVTQLHRVHTAGFANESMYEIVELMSQDTTTLMNRLLPMERAIPHVPLLTLNQENIIRLMQGKTVEGVEHQGQEGCFRLHDGDGNFIGLGEINDNGLLKVKRLLSSNYLIG